MKLSKSKRPSRLYKLVKWLIWLFFPKMKVFGKEHLPDGPVIIVANHCQMNGPIACEWYLPGNRYTWCAAQMMKAKEVPAYAFEDFWSQKPKYTHPFYKVLSYLITPISVLVFNNANTIPVYHDNRVLITFKDTVAKLKDGAQIVIFPEHDVKRNHIVYDFQDKFIDVAKLYYKRTGQELTFVPMYITPKLKGMYIGEGTRFSADAPIAEERRRICEYLMDSITAIACDLPEHTVVPYRNIPRRQYPTNIPKEENR